MTSDQTLTRRHYSAQFRTQVLAECDAPGAALAKVAMSDGVNTNVVHGSRELARETGGACVVSSPGQSFKLLARLGRHRLTQVDGGVHGRKQPSHWRSVQ
jgi:transposase-like protein